MNRDLFLSANRGIEYGSKVGLIFSFSFMKKLKLLVEIKDRQRIVAKLNQVIDVKIKKIKKNQKRS